MTSRRVTRRKVRSADRMAGLSRGSVRRLPATWEVSVDGSPVGLVTAGFGPAAVPAWVPNAHGLALGLDSRAVVRATGGLAGLIARIAARLDGAPGGRP